MKPRHVRLRVEAMAVGFQFSDLRLLLDPDRETGFDWKSLTRPREIEPVAWEGHCQFVERQLLESACPIVNFCAYASRLLEEGGPWMTLRSINPERPTEDQIRLRAFHYWNTRKSSRGDDWNDWFSASNALWDEADFQPGDEILRWRWVSLALPTSMFIAAVSSRECVPVTRVRVLDPSIAPAGDVALLHAHHGAMTPFESIWCSLGDRLVSGDVGQLESDLREDNPLMSQPNSSGLWVEILRKAFLVREVLVRHANHSARIDVCARCDLAGDQRNLLHYFANNPRLSKTPIRHSTPGPWRGTHSEEFFLRAAFHHSQSEAVFRRLFLQYLRVKVLLFRWLVAHPDRPGATAFDEVYDRSLKYGGAVPDRSSLRDILRSEIGIRLSSVEVRTTPGGWNPSDLESAAPFVDKSIESGWILHFLRTDGATADPRRKREKIKKAVKEREKNVQKLMNAIRTRPELLQHLRGLDIAGLERAAPMWSFVKLIRELRRESRLSATRCPGLHPLRVTLHVGEDFDHLMTGLRSVYEPFAWSIMERGDRLGHATALGIDPAEWQTMTLQRRGALTMRPWDRLMDIGWVHHAFQRFRLRFESPEWMRLNVEAESLLRRLGIPTDLDGNPLTVAKATSVASSLWLGLGSFDPRIVQRFSGLDLCVRVPVHMLTDDYSFDLEHDMGLLNAVHRPLAAFVAQSGVAIEANPTSNMIVAGLPVTFAQPTFQMRATDRSHLHALPVTISSDDPLMFATCLADEYAYAWAGMVLGHDMPPSYARAWLDEAAATSMRFRFTVPVA